MYKRCLLAILGFGLLCPSGALAQYTQYQIPPTFSTPTGTVTVGTPSGITQGPDGNVWFTCEKGGVIGAITPLGQITLYSVAPASSSLGGITTGPDGNVWFTDFTDKRVERIATDGSGLVSYPLGAYPGGITSNAGYLWVAETLVGKVARVSLTGQVTTYALSSSNSYPHGVNPGPDGNLWFAEISGDKIGLLTPLGRITEFPIPTVNSNPRVIVGDPALGTLFFSEYLGNKIGEITTSGAITEFPVPTPNSRPDGVTVTPSGLVAFTENGANQVGELDPSSGLITEFPAGTNTGPDKITVGSDGRVWFTEAKVNAIGAM